jgi:hypothetical protein
MLQELTVIILLLWTPLAQLGHSMSSTQKATKSEPDTQTFLPEINFNLRVTNLSFAKRARGLSLFHPPPPQL